MTSHEILTIESKLQRNDVPIKNFNKVLENQLNESHNDQDSYYLVYNKYINCLRDFYYQKFVSFNNQNYRKAERRAKSILSQCESDMKSAIPSCFKDEWLYTEIYEELVTDIDTYLLDIKDSSDSVDNTKREQFLKRFKWFSSQIALLSISYLQNEFVSV